jgi:hypothetical protein
LRRLCELRSIPSARARLHPEDPQVSCVSPFLLF